MALNLQPEIELLLGCARLRLSDAAAARLRVLVTHQLDWQQLLVEAKRHAFVPLLFERLSALCPGDVPDGFGNQLRELFYANAARNLRLTDELGGIIKLFNAASIPVITYKGPALAEALYGDVTLRQFSDLDLMIHRADVARACRILGESGFERQHKLTPAQETFFLKSECEHLFARGERHIFLDLHWDFAPRYFSLRLDPEPMWERLETIRLGETPALTFNAEDTLLVLCIHAGKDFWQRLVSLADIAGWLAIHQDLNWPVIIERATNAHARRILLISLQLAHLLFDAALPEPVNEAMKQDAAIHRLATEIAGALLKGEAKPSAAKRFLLPVRAYESLRDRLNFCLRLALTPSPEDWAFVRIPDRFSFLYYFTRPVRLALKYKK